MRMSIVTATWNSNKTFKKNHQDYDCFCIYFWLFAYKFLSLYRFCNILIINADFRFCNT